MRLGDLDALKKHKFTTQIANGVEIEDIDVVPVAAIDNAPTVEEVSLIEFKEPLPLVKTQKIVKTLSERPQGEWIPASERLPEENVCDDGYHEPSKWVLVQTSGGQMYTSRYWSRDKENVWTDLNYPEDIVAWQSLPEPYKGGGEEG